MQNGKINLPRNDPTFGLRFPEPPPNSPPQLITDPALVQQLRDAMNAPATRPQSRRRRPKRREKPHKPPNPRTAAELATLYQWHKDGLTLLELAKLENITIHDAAALIREAKAQEEEAQKGGAKKQTMPAE